jgi:BirA family biotin operon repressor/biotin-[acetyl-CoA-carboxylase] ligase
VIDALDEIRSQLAGTRFADVRVVAETGSTNADVAALARDGASEGIVVAAEHQTAGRGRLDRAWLAPPGSSLLVSILTRPTAEAVALGVEQLHLVSMAVGVAAAEAARALTGADIRLKWPNDLVVDDDAGVRKLSGILSESLIEGDAVEAVVVGIGINVNWPPDMPQELDGLATALNHLVGHEIDRVELLVGMLHGLDTWYGALGSSEGRAGLLLRYRELSATLGHRVRVDLGGEVVVGEAIDIGPEGHLLVADECVDQAREIVAGDVVRVRPTT